MVDQFLGQIEESPEHIAGLIENDEHCYTVTDVLDDPIDREFSIHDVYDDRGPNTATQLYLTRQERTRNRPSTSIHRMIKIFECTKGRSVHFPRVVAFGKIRRLFYGDEGEQEAERDPEGKARQCMVLQYDGTQLGSLLTLSPGGVTGVEVAILVGLGCVRALSSLHRLGYVHRQVSPYTICYPNPLSYDGLEAGLILPDLSLALPWPCKPRGYVPFVGTLRYSSVRAHRGREQGPADDIISVIYMMAEFISGKLPWRSARSSDMISFMKSQFYFSEEFRRLPQEVRGLYRLMYMTSGCAALDYKYIIEELKKAQNRRCPGDQQELPGWANIPPGDGW